MEIAHTQSQEHTQVASIEPGCPPTTVAAVTTERNFPDEINLLEYFYVLLKHKYWIIFSAILGFPLGFFIAQIIGPTWVSEAVIAPIESEKQNVPNLSGLGTFGLMASQLNFGGNPGLDKIEVVLDSKSFNSEVIDKYGLLPLLYKNHKPREFKEFFDNEKKVWKNEFVRPNLLGVGSILRKEYLKKEIKENKTMTLRFSARDSLFVDTLMSSYLEYLNNYIQVKVQNDAKANVSYLENQLITISDPLLREKIQTMLATELEKAMLVSKEAFKIIDPKYTYRQFKIKILFPIIFSFSLFTIVILFFIFGHAVISKSRSQEDQYWLSRIKQEFRHFF